MKDTDDFREKYKVIQGGGKKGEENPAEIDELYRFGLYREIKFNDKEESPREESSKKERTEKANKWKKFYAKKGSAKEANAKAEKKGKMSKRLKVRIAATLLAATVVGGIIGYVATGDKGENQTIEQLMEQNADLSKLGLKKESIDTLLKYNELFESEKSEMPSNVELMDMSQDIYNLIMSVTKQKFATVLGCSESDLEIRYHFDNSTGRKETQIRFRDAHSDTSRIIYQDAGANLFSIPNEETLPKEICDVIWQLDSINDLNRDLKNEKISSSKAFKNLKEYFSNLQNFSTKELIMAKDGQLSLISYKDAVREDNKTDKSEERE